MPVSLRVKESASVLAAGGSVWTLGWVTCSVPAGAAGASFGSETFRKRNTPPTDSTSTRHTSTIAKPQLCFVGCPHLTLKQLQDWTANIEEGLKKNGLSKVSVPTVFTAAPDVLKAFEATGDAAKLKSFGVITSYICPLMYMNNPLCKKKTVITCSNKLRTYTSARFYTEDEILGIITGKEGKK